MVHCKVKKTCKINEIDILKIRLLNDDDDLVIIPNSKVYCELTIEKERACSLEIIDNELQVSKDSDIAHLSPESCRVFLSLKEENKIPEVFE